MKRGESKMVELIVTLPCHNEASSLVDSITKVKNEVNNLPYDFIIVIAEDGSTDGTSEIARKLAINDPNVIHIHSDRKLGRGKALKNAWHQFEGEVYTYMDADLATDLSILPNLITITRQKRGITTASRRILGAKVGRPILRKITSFCYNWLVRILFRDGIHDHECGCKAFHRDLIHLLDEVESDGWFWDTEIIVRAKRKGYPVVEIPCKWSEPTERKSKVNIFRDALSMGMSAIKLYLSQMKES